MRELNVTERVRESGYESCLIKPMSGDNGDPLIRWVHVVDAFIVAGIVFFSLILGSTLPGLIWTGSPNYLTFGEVRARLLTGVMAFFLTFLAQWARYRGIKIRKRLNGGS